MYYKLFTSILLVILLVIASNSFHKVSPEVFKKVICQEVCYAK